MKFKFEELEYQKKAINSVLELFEGQETGQSVFTVENNMHQIGIEENLTTDGYSVGIGNRLDLTDEELLNNMHKVQLHNGLPQTSEHDNKYPEFDINMETGTGKTYVYLKTIFELKKKYNFSKFIIVVPSVAIKEGVKKSLDVTFEQFKQDYPEIPYSNSSYFVYDSSKPELVRDFAVNSNLSIMVITIAAFNKDKNVIHQEDRETGKLIDLIRSTNPILIIDEPQLVDNTTNAQNSIKLLNPLVSFRYSATHDRKSNLIYSFDSIDAYEGEYVKQIEVASFSTEDYDNSAYIRVKSIKSNKNTITANVEISVLNDAGKVSKKDVKIDKYKKNNLFSLSGGREVYANYRVKDIYCEPDNKYIEFLNGVEVREGQCIGDIDDIKLKRQQIRKTIEEHLNKEKMFAMKNLGIKVLSLFFVDRVDKYRYYDENGIAQKGEYAKIFEEEYKSVISQSKYNDLLYKADSTPVEEVHNGYFSIDKKVVTPYSETTEKTGKGAEESTYNLIMKDKERLLSLDNKLRFIFSHSALGVGWDNPNVFQICTLAENRQEVDRRQKIGRGLRLCVNQDGRRVKGFDVNTLTVVANESYEEFASQLQHEIEKEDKGIKFGTLEYHSFANIPIKQEDGSLEYLGEQKSKAIFDYFVSVDYIDNNGKVKEILKQDLKNDELKVPEEFSNIKEQIQTITKKRAGKLNIKDNSKKQLVQLKNEVFLDPEFIKLWDSIKYKTVYSIEFETEELIDKCSRAIISDLNCDSAVVISKLAKLEMSEAGIETKEIDSSISGTIDDVSYYPDIITFLQNKTNLTRKTIVKILIQSKTLHIFKRNPQSYMTEVARIIQRQLRNLILNGIKYTKLGDDCYYAQELLKENPLYGYLEKNMIEAPSNKYPFSHVVYDSDNEASFAEKFENNRNILKYVKLPSKFKIPTPLGPYNPDWAVLVDQNGERKLYFVLETKRENLQIALDDDLRQNEKDKIYCGRKHFEALNTNAQFETVTNFDKFIHEAIKI